MDMSSAVSERAPALAEASLIVRARQGDVAAFEQLVATYRGGAYRVALSVTRDHHDAEEAVAEAFVRAYRALRRFRPGAPFRPWLLRIAGNEARRIVETRRRQARIAEHAIAFLERPADGPEPLEPLTRAEARARLVRALVLLGERDRSVIGCRYLLALTESETAEWLGLPPGTVKSRLSRGLQRLRLILEAHEFDRPAVAPGYAAAAAGSRAA